MSTDLSSTQNERLRALSERILKDHLKGSRSQFAWKISRAQPSVSDFLNGRTGASHETARRIVALAAELAMVAKGLTVEDCIGAPDDPLPVPPKPTELDAAKQMAQPARIDTSMVERVIAEVGPLGDDKDRFWWFEQFKHAHFAETRAMTAQSRLGKAPPRARKKESTPEADAAPETKRPRRRKTGT